MGKAIPVALRQRIVDLCKSGFSLQQVCQKLDLAYPGVAKIWRNYRRQGESALELGYHRCGRKPVYDPSVHEAINDALSANEDLGAPIIRSRLLAQGNLAKVPHERTIQRWWREQGKSKARGRRQQKDTGYATEVHDTWQADAKEQVTIADESKHTWLSFADEASCSFLRGHVFPLEKTDEKR